MKKKLLTISIVSHNHHNKLNLILPLLQKIPRSKCDVIIRSNIPESNFLNQVKANNFYYYTNNKKEGFAFNHNLNFKKSNSTYFCILNPDVFFDEKIFFELLDAFSFHNVGAVGPMSINRQSKLTNNNFRNFPNFKNLFLRFIRLEKRFPRSFNLDFYEVDWISGMFIIIKSNLFKEIGGFDENFFLYLEDVDICKRIKKLGNKVLVSKKISVIHEGMRKSRYHPYYFFLHLKSLFYYFKKDFFIF